MSTDDRRVFTTLQCLPRVHGAAPHSAGVESCKTLRYLPEQTSQEQRPSRMNQSTVSHFADHDPTPPTVGLHRDLCSRYSLITTGIGLEWHTSFRILRLLGKGGQGIVFLSQREGSDEF